MAKLFKNGLAGGLCLILFIALCYLSPYATYNIPTMKSIFAYHEIYKLTSLVIFPIFIIFLIKLTPSTEYQNQILYISTLIVSVIVLIYYIFQAFVWNPPPAIFYWNNFIAFLTFSVVVVTILEIWHIFFHNRTHLIKFDPSKQYRVYFRPFKKYHKFKTFFTCRGIQLFTHVGVWDAETQTFYSFRKEQSKRVRKQENALSYIKKNISNGNIIHIEEIDHINDMTNIIGKKYSFTKYNCWHFVKEATK